MIQHHPKDSVSATFRPRVLYWTYDACSPSFRHRHLPVLACLGQRGWECRVEEMSKGRYFRRIAERRHELRDADVLVLAKTRLSLGEPLLLPSLAKRIVFDLDDAIYCRQARKLTARVNQSVLRRLKFHHTCRIADLITVGNEQLASEASRYGRWVEIVPTSVQPSPEPDQRRTGRTLVWIGMPENLQYLELIRRPLAELQRRFEGLKLRVICSEAPPWPEIDVEWVPWTDAIEGPALASADIGLMPLTDDEWTRGKCGFKLLQYMAHGIPCVASPVGVNQDLVRWGHTGFLAYSRTDWVYAIGRLLDDPVLRRQVGLQGWNLVRRKYARESVAERYADLLAKLCRDESPVPRSIAPGRGSVSSRASGVARLHASFHGESGAFTKR